MNDDLRDWIAGEYRSEGAYATDVCNHLERAGWRIVPPGWDVVRLKRGREIMVEDRKKRWKAVTVPTLDIAEWFGTAGDL